MEFNTWKSPSGKDYVEDFISNFDDRTDETECTSYKILDKLCSWEALTFQQLMAAGHMEKARGKVFVARVRIRTKCYRFFGAMQGEDRFIMVHAIIKKSNSFFERDIKIAEKRIQLIQL